MANEEQLKILKSGVENWNRWREENPNENIDLKRIVLVMADLKRINLSGASLNNANLSGSNLTGSNFNRAVLNNVNLSSAILVRAELINASLINTSLLRAALEWADFRGANLKKAELISTSLISTTLKGAILSEANFSGAYIRGARLNNANFNKAHFGMTTFSDIDLSNTKNIDACIHSHNSYIDYHTLKKSKDLPLSFLRGCGLSDSYIKALPSIIEQEEQFFNCFISYSSKDEKFADKLYNDLQDRGVRVWFAPEDMKIADKIRPALHKAIERHEKLLIILSKDSIKSPWVEDEVEKAFEQERKKKENVLFPIRVDDTIFKTEAGWADSIKNTRNIGDFTKWKDHYEYKRNFDRLVESLRIETETK